MAKVGADFVFPTGQFQPSQFGFTTDNELATHIQTTWIDVVEAAVTDVTDEMVCLYVCWKANEVLAGAAVSNAGLKRVEIGDAEKEYFEGGSGSDAFSDRYLSCKEEYNRLLDNLESGDDPDGLVIVV